MKKNSKVSIEELTDYEIFKIETQSKIDKYEKELAKNKKTISNLKSRDRVYSKALSLCENKINNLKKDSMDKLLFLCENIKEIRKSFYEQVNNLENLDLKENFLQIGEEYEYMLNSIYDVCNKIEENAVFTKVDKEIISTKFEMSDLSRMEEVDQFAEMRNEIQKGISKKGAKSTSEKRQIKAINEIHDDFDEEIEEAESVVYNRKENQLSEEESKILSNKFSEMFYGTPTSSNVVSGIKPSVDGDFDFNEALNPTMSLSDIMKDLVSSDDVDEDDESFDDDFSDLEVLTQNEAEKTEKVRQERLEKIESKMSQNAKFERREDDVDYKEFQEKTPANKKEDYEKRFTYLQNIFKDLNR